MTTARPTVRVHLPYDRTYRRFPLPERHATVGALVTEARRNGATAHADDEPCKWCATATDATAETTDAETRHPADALYVEVVETATKTLVRTGTITDEEARALAHVAANARDASLRADAAELVNDSGRTA